MSRTDRIDFISAYCDRWCERCGFTDRCSAFACDIAIAMCGDVAAGIELAVGIPEPVDGVRPQTIGERLLADYVEPSAQEMAVIDRQERARDERIEKDALARMSRQYGSQATTWLDSHSELETSADPIVREAFAVVSWDAHLIGAKVRRALDGRDRSIHDGNEGDDDPVQNDWNGSAKVALLSLERSESAWAAIATVSNDRTAGILAEAVTHLRVTMLREFPKAMEFMRPGFDEPWR